MQTSSLAALPVYQKERILIVEDEAANLKLLSTYLDDAGYRIDTAADGREALEKLRATRDYALVVTDRLMPVMDGMELFKQIRQDKKLKSLPVIMQTGANAPQEISEGIKAGVYYYLTKPYQEETLLTLVNSAIRDSQQQQSFVKRLTEQKQALNTFLQGQFQIQTMTEAENVAFLLSGMFAQPERAVTGLYELIVNAIEHGTLGIGLEKKSQLLNSGNWQDEIKYRLGLPENTQKHVTVSFTKNDRDIIVTITDQGPGFDWRPFMEIEPSRATQSNGRGIAKANLLCFNSVTYQGNGNSVQITGDKA